MISKLRIYGLMWHGSLNNVLNAAIQPLGLKCSSALDERMKGGLHG